MIEKLDTKEIEKDCGAFGKIIVERKLATEIEMQDKINELVDAVNELQKNATHSKTKKVETPADPYAEQRKWIGKLCHFWNKTEYTDDIYGFLTDIVPTNKYKPEDNYFVPFKDEFGSFYEHCEPVKPDDNIIYKGEQQ